jgi:hypothetical protein
VSGENFIMRNLRILILTHYCASDKIEKSDMGEACSAYGK